MSPPPRRLALSVALALACGGTTSSPVSIGVAVVIEPSTATVAPSGTVLFTASVVEAADQSVDWSVQEGSAGGSVMAGTYTAPAAPGTYHVVATSHADPTKKDIATVTVRAAPLDSGWLHISGHRIVDAGEQPFHGRGANLHDTRSCNACAYGAANPGEVKRRIDALVDDWHANFMRLDLESYAAADGRVTWAGVLADPQYLADVQDIVAHAVAKPGVYVLLSLWVNPTFTTVNDATHAAGWPTAATHQEWTLLADTFKDEPHVLFGLVNEPQYNGDGALDAAVWSAMNDTVQAIRDVESAAGTPHHVITVQGTRGWARTLDYYVTHPITAGGGVNIAYETHVYNPATDFAALFETPAQSIPVVIGEFGPTPGPPTMTLADCTQLMQRAETAGTPYLAWTFHMRCPPNLLVENSGGGCGENMTLAPTDWGQLLKDHLAQPW